MTCKAFKCSIPQPPRLGSFTSLYFLGSEHPDTSHSGVGLTAGAEMVTSDFCSIVSGRREGGTENVNDKELSLLEETHRNRVGMAGGGNEAGVSSASASPSSSTSTGAGPPFFPLGRDCFLRRRLIVSV